MGGEKFFHEPEELPGGGSPPHGRGKVRCSVQLDVCHGITPA